MAVGITIGAIALVLGIQWLIIVALAYLFSLSLTAASLVNMVLWFIGGVSLLVYLALDLREELKK